MSRLHKIDKFPLIKRYYLAMILLILFGVYKNGFLPFFHNYGSGFKMIMILLLPILSFGIGFIFDLILKNKEIFNNKFFSLLFSMIIPFSTNLVLYFIFLIFYLFLSNFLIQKRKSLEINHVVLAKIVLVGLLILFKIYSYQNGLETTGSFQYSFLDKILGHNISGIYTSSILLIFGSLLLFSTNIYYKKEIPLYSYGIYILTLAFYAVFKNDMAFLLNHFFQSSVLFGLVFIASLSTFTPFVRRNKFIYSFILGVTILPFSQCTNFFEGIYISILFANVIDILINLFTEKIRKWKKL